MIRFPARPLAALAVLALSLPAMPAHASGMNEYTLAPGDAAPAVTSYRPATVMPVETMTVDAVPVMAADPVMLDAGEIVFDTQPLPLGDTTTETVVMQPYRPAPLQPVGTN